ncbi:LytTR family DNA-binding domain-containing protein [Lipingzhangella sp. LS1_29]|uniref:LytTR family DNA-binding domain-containing protein n=2 Tax=Lipingzhangella rawalii TaxID=2055835 RepID=A0ABU2H087_9ACTN|nr:LytTR family DNA-binding domain-containing protein [Lipingzhangella rawalii]
MLRVLAVDDEAPALEELAYLLRQDSRVGHVAVADDAPQAMRLVSDSVAQGEPFDALFLDIRMPGPSGIDIARFVGALARPPDVVFVTAHEDFAVTAFSLRATDYLLKPLREERVAETVRRIAEARNPQEEDPRVPVELGGRTRLIPRGDIRYAEAQGDYVRLRTAEGGYLIRSTLSALEREWEGAGFVRIHRSVLVAVRHVSELRTDGARARVKVGEEYLPVSRRQTREVREHLLRQVGEQS